MLVKKQELQEFQKIYKEVHGVEINEEEATKYATSLLNFIKTSIKNSNF